MNDALQSISLHHSCLLLFLTVDGVAQIDSPAMFINPDAHYHSITLCKYCVMNHDRNHQADLLLQHSQRDQSGRLTIFLGAAPGVGKTFAMLMRAHELVLTGCNIVIGYVETHGRRETENLLAGLTIIPRKKMPYQGHQLEEMDIDALLEQKPDIVLVDELAHTNMPGSRHEKRWQDIHELLDAGIDVFTTMNIQHLESLNDLVFQITGIRVIETVPDRVFERIRDIRLIDLPVNELLERLNQGKIYLSDQAQHALDGFFSHTNLTALRELAMQTVASYVDTHVRENFAIQGLQPIPLSNHILILLDRGIDAEALVRKGCRMAEHRFATWTVVVFSQQSHFRMQFSITEQRAIEQALNLTRQLGGMTEILYGKQAVQPLLNYIVGRGISSVVLAQRPYHRQYLSRIFRPDIARQLLKYQPNFELSIVPVSGQPIQNRTVSGQAIFLSPQEMVYIVATTIGSIILASWADQYLGIEDFSVIFITAVVLVASQTRTFVAFVSAIVFFLAYNFFFISPKLTLQISAHQGVMTVLAFLAAALISGRLASRLKEQVTALKAANSYKSIMQDLGQQLSTAIDLEQVRQIAEQRLAQHLHAQVLLCFPDIATAASGLVLNDKEQVCADWTLKNHQPSGRFTQTLTGNDWWFLPLLASKQCFGVVGLKFPSSETHLHTAQKQLAEAMIEYVAQALSRIQLSKALEVANINSETEKLRSALLSSVSHDLRSPLASMIGAADTLSHYRHAMNDQDQNSLLEAIRLEGERLDRYIQNLLDMTRLGHEGLSLKRDWIGIDELVGSAVRRLSRYMPQVIIEVNLPASALSLFVHAALIEQAIFNVLENAAKFAPEHTAVTLDVTASNDNQIEIAITDQGQGIPKEERERIFDMFYSMQRGDRGQYGTGLGLTIVKAIIGAHMGHISASSADHHQGTCIRIQLPIQPIL